VDGDEPIGSGGCDEAAGGRPAVPGAALRTGRLPGFVVALPYQQGETAAEEIPSKILYL
jgi:hypothetical protein